MRFNEPFSGPVIPFGAEITYKPITDKDKARLHQFGIKVLSGVFIGYSLNIGGGWSGDLLVADWEDIEAAERPKDVYIKRFKAQEVKAAMVNNQFVNV